MIALGAHEMGNVLVVLIVYMQFAKAVVGLNCAPSVTTVWVITLGPSGPKIRVALSHKNPPQAQASENPENRPRAVPASPASVMNAARCGQQGFCLGRLAAG